MADRPLVKGPLSALGIGVVAATIVADQITKALAETLLPFGQTIEVLPFLALHRVHNPGIAFSLLAGFDDWALIAMVLAVTAVVVGVWARTREGGNLAAIAFALIVGGALGNLVDRLVYGHVVDFLLLHIGQRPLFVFNLADAALSVGPALLILTHIWPRKASSH
jgi:signal peptidase II